MTQGKIMSAFSRLALHIPGTPTPEKWLKCFLEEVVKVNGPNPWDPQIQDERFYKMVVEQGMFGLGEAYVEGYWDCNDVAGFFYRACCAGLLERMANSTIMKALQDKFRTTNAQEMEKARENARFHYSQGNKLFEATLGPRLAYTCNLWRNPLDLKDGETLEEAEIRKLDLICQKLHLKPGMTLLDIGCGWGSLIGFAAERYGVKAVGVTPVPEQVEYVNKRYGGKLPVKAIEADYRNMCLPDQFDRVVSVGMFEHVGRKNFRTYMEVVDKYLKLDGLSFIHCFGISDKSVPLVDTWTEARIFPGIELPTISEITGAAEDLFDTLDVHEIGIHYYKTLLSWHRNFVNNWNQISDDYGERFFRIWTYYLQSCAGAFLARKVLLWQQVYTQKEAGIVYQSVR